MPPSEPGTLVDRARLDGLNAHETAFLYEEIVTRRGYLPEGLELPEHAVVLDVGANIGVYALFVRAHCPTATVYAFEPLPPIFDKLRRNLAAHGEAVKLFPYGLADRTGEARFTFYPGYTTMSARSALADTAADRAYVRDLVVSADGADGPGLGDAADFLDEMLDYRFREEPYDCRLRRLSEVIEEERLTRIDMLKIDVQRAEAEVLHGIDDEHWPLIRQLAVEVHDEPGTATAGRLHGITADLEARGFAVRVRQDGTTANADRAMVFASRSFTHSQGDTR
ncbi:FkbM family methyltransferase [Streptomyces sp. NRRL WC-3742]|uniref:FkbM family methyltransferase n=1 Tax=Streptomyces sp. NRRL WC-3742 TaxID=1463934 RepID=UPI000691250B|nr:FkbM family methyltransferase [Streptomyces sp. NRRL WC-3742]